MRGENSSSRALITKIDWWIIACYILLVFTGWINIYASIHTDSDVMIMDMANRSGKQFLWICISLSVAIALVFFVPPRIYEPAAPMLYIIVLLLLIAVIFLGASINGSHSWFKFGPISFQPAEMSKITTSLMLAGIMSRNGYRLKGKDMWITFAALALPMFIIVLEKETGTALVYLSFIFMLYREGLSGWLIAIAGLTILLFILTLILSPFISILILISLVSLFDSVISGRALWWAIIAIPSIVGVYFIPEEWKLWVIISICILYALYSLWRLLRGIRQKFRIASLIVLASGVVLVCSTRLIFDHVLKGYQKDRIEVLLGIKEDLSGAGYNVHQSEIAIGSGGMWGKGFCNGTQTAFGFVPEQSTDFIFCTLGEEWGFVGCTAVILIYVLLIIRIIRDSEQSREAFTRIYGYCVAGILFMHVFINIGMTIGIMPVIGIPLPFMSYGGSSLLAFTFMLFIFIALYKNEKKYF